MEGRQRRSFTDDYKRQAVDFVASSGRSIGSVAKELGLRDSVLRRWVEQRGAGGEPTVPLVFFAALFAVTVYYAHTDSLTATPWTTQTRIRH
jgi:transposase-like protein